MSPFTITSNSPDGARPRLSFVLDCARYRAGRLSPIENVFFYGGVTLAAGRITLGQNSVIGAGVKELVGPSACRLGARVLSREEM